jgi:hypothetical protein
MDQRMSAELGTNSLKTLSQNRGLVGYQLMSVKNALRPWVADVPVQFLLNPGRI